MNIGLIILGKRKLKKRVIFNKEALILIEKINSILSGSIDNGDEEH